MTRNERVHPVTTEQAATDQRMMALALRLARRGLGSTAPNPAVGAVVVRGAGDGLEVTGRGWTGPGGRPHAETIALGRAGEAARGATLYVTLEPCNHHGRTPPCTEAIIAAGIARVVAAHADPDPRVAGHGLARLAAAGVEVVVGVDERAARLVNAGHVMRHVLGRPYVVVKLAVSVDGRMAAGDGAPRWVTAPATRAAGHLLRAEADVLMVGVGTVLADDPSLDCRLPGMAQASPDIVVVDSVGRTPPEAALLAAPHGRPGRRVTLLTTAPMPARPDDSRVVTVPATPEGRVDLAAALRQLAGEGVTRVLVEGGPTLARALIDADLADEVALFTGVGRLGAAGLLPLVDRGLAELHDTGRWEPDPALPIGAEFEQHFFRVRPSPLGVFI